MDHSALPNTPPSNRYALVSTPEWQNLLTHFDLAEGFAFIVLLVPDADGSNVCRQALERYLTALGKTLHVISLCNPGTLQNLADRLLDTTVSPMTGAIWAGAVASLEVPSATVRDTSIST